jgi:hypothetical protein
LLLKLSDTSCPLGLIVIGVVAIKQAMRGFAGRQWFWIFLDYPND